MTDKQLENHAQQLVKKQKRYHAALAILSGLVAVEEFINSQAVNRIIVKHALALADELIKQVEQDAKFD